MSGNIGENNGNGSDQSRMTTNSATNSAPLNSPNTISIGVHFDDHGDLGSEFESVSPADSGNGSKEELEQRGLWKRFMMALGLSSRPSLQWRNSVPSIIKPLNEYPGGYSKLAAYQDIDPNFLIFRKHGWLRNRLLEHYQDQLAEIEADLLLIDEADSREDSRFPKSRRLRKGPDSPREKLFGQLKSALDQYDELLLRTQQIMAFKRPTKRNQRSVYNFIQNTAAQLHLEAEWIRHSHDLAAISTDHEHGWLNGFLEDTLRAISKKLTVRIFRTKSQRKRTGSETVMLVSQKRFNMLISVCVTILTTALLLIPVAILAECVEAGIKQVFVIFGFTLTFALCCAIFTKAKRQEIFAATAAYCAVLVVFLGNTNNSRYN